ncbi:unnamed protein product [Phytophthora fragariaefolia]|uniref:Unnamed protein product n=1 Tax=Phytophthora fragariaefolia TaxID=1490495 RepID=A0A9W6YFG6_9STRA|nr:unnamed protein product [Phytophthora fragariaefolia]
MSTTIQKIICLAIRTFAPDPDASKILNRLQLFTPVAVNPWFTVTDSGYRVNPWVHVSRLKPRALFPKRPTVEIEVAEDDDFDAVLLPEDSWEPDSERNEYEVEKILDL